MQQKLNDKNDMILLERQQWEKEKDEIKGLVNLDSEVVSLNVGGTHHLKTERDVLRLVKGSILEKMFNGMNELKEIDGEVFLDRDGSTFLNLVNYLRNDREVFPDFMDHNDERQFLKELEFWKVPTKYGKMGKSLAPVPQVQSYQSQKVTVMSQQQNDAMSGVSGGEDSQGVALKAAKDKWNELGPLRLDDIVANSEVPIDQSMKFGQSKYNKFIIGQLGGNGKVTGVGKEINHIIYEGQFLNDVYNGFGRFIYSNGNYYIGNWEEGKRSGFGKLVDK